MSLILLSVLLALSTSVEAGAPAASGPPISQEKKFGFRHDPRRSMKNGLGEERLVDFDRAVGWIVKRQRKTDGTWPGPGSQAVGTTALGALVLLGGGLDVEKEELDAALARALDWLEEHQDESSGRIDSGEDAPDPVRQHVLATWALLEAHALVGGRGKAELRRALDALLAVQDPAGHFPARWGASAPDERTSALAGLVLALAGRLRHVDAGAARLSVEWLHSRTAEIVRASAPAAGERALVAAYVLGALALDGKDTDLDRIGQVSEWLAANPPVPGGDLEELVLVIHAAHQLGKPAFPPLETVLHEETARVEKAGRERGSRRPGDRPGGRSEATGLLVMAQQVYVRWASFFAR